MLLCVFDAGWRGSKLEMEKGRGSEEEKCDASQKVATTILKIGLQGSQSLTSARKHC